MSITIPAELLPADGRYVAFWSDSSNLVDNDTNGNIGCRAAPCSDVFVRDMVAGTTTRSARSPRRTDGR